jgi:hypothetical protein
MRHSFGTMQRYNAVKYKYFFIKNILKNIKMH